MNYENVETKYRNTIKNYKLFDGIKNIIYLFSGGKDATFGLHLLINYIKSNNLNINLTVPMVFYPKHVYLKGEQISTESDNVLKYWKSRNIDLLTLHSPKADLPDNKTGCDICKKARMELVAEVLNQTKATDTAVVTGYTMYDIMAYLEQFALFTGYTFDMDRIAEEKSKRSVLNSLHKMKIKQLLPNGITVVRPLLVFNEAIVLEYLNHNKIPFVSEPCKVSDYKHKRMYFKSLQIVGKHNQCSYEDILTFLKKHHVELPNDNDAVNIESETQFTDC